MKQQNLAFQALAQIARQTLQTVTKSQQLEQAVAKSKQTQIRKTAELAELFALLDGDAIKEFALQRQKRLQTLLQQQQAKRK